MTRFSGLVFSAILSIAVAFAVPPSPNKPTHKPLAASTQRVVVAAKTQAKAGPQFRPVSAHTASLRTAHGHVLVNGKIVRGRHVVARSTASSFQARPDEDRYRQIQQALTDKGYFKGEVNGQWSEDSVQALQKFQSDNKLPDIYSDGKINSLSLIGLGLGPKHGAHAGEAVPTPQMPPAPETLPPTSSSAFTVPTPQ